MYSPEFLVETFFIKTYCEWSLVFFRQETILRTLFLVIVLGYNLYFSIANFKKLKPTLIYEIFLAYLMYIFLEEWKIIIYYVLRPSPLLHYVDYIIIVYSITNTSTSNNNNNTNNNYNNDKNNNN